MKLEQDITETLTRICDQFATAIERYDAISGGEEPPEQFISSQVLMGLGDVLTMTAETNVGKLWRWYSPSQPPDEIRSISTRRVDVLIFSGEHTKKQDMIPFFPIELKFGYVDDNDIQKLGTLLKYVRSCKYAAICTAIEVRFQTYIEERVDAARRMRRQSVTGRIARPLWSKKDWQTYGEIISGASPIETNELGLV